MLFVFEVLYVARRYVIDVYAGLCLHSRPREAELRPMIMLRGASITYIPSRVPSKPGRPVAKCDGGIYVTVTWTRPEDNGGGDITSYVIKYADEDYATVKVHGYTTNFTFTDQLEELTQYQFAVAAVNTAGRGEFSVFSDYVRTGYGK